MRYRDLSYFTYAELTQYTHVQLAALRLYIIDRTEKDILEETRKGSLKADDLNRIEDNSQYINQRLFSVGHSIYTPAKTDWKREDWPTAQELNRITKIVSRLRDSFCRIPEMPELPTYLQTPHYSDINAIEKTQKELDKMVSNMLLGYWYSGTFYCGEELK